MGKWLIGLGLLIAAVGVIMQYAPWLLGWFGKLPGDIRIDGENGKVFVPLASMIVVSLLLTLVVNLLRR